MSDCFDSLMCLLMNINEWLFWFPGCVYSGMSRVTEINPRVLQRMRLSITTKKISELVKYSKYLFFLKKKHFWEGISPFCRATDTPVLDFWWHLDWVSRPEWIPLHVWFDACMQQIPLNHLWCDTCWPLGSQHGNWAVLSTYLYFINLKIFTEYATPRKKICVWIHYFSHCMEFVRNNILVFPFLKFSRICQIGQVLKNTRDAKRSYL